MIGVSIFSFNKKKNNNKKNQKTSGSPGGSVVKNSPMMQERMVWFLGGEVSLEEEIPWTEGWQATVNGLSKELDMTYWINNNII